MSEKYHFSYIDMKLSEEDILRLKRIVKTSMMRDRFVSIIGIVSSAAAFALTSVNYFRFHGQPLYQGINLTLLGLSFSMLCYYVHSLFRKIRNEGKELEGKKLLESLKDESTFVNAFEEMLKKPPHVFYERVGSGYIIQSTPLFEESFSNIRKLWFSILSQYDLSADIIRFFEDRIAHMESDEQRASTLIYLEVLKEQLQSGNMLILDSIESGNGLANYKCEEVEMP